MSDRVLMQSVSKIYQTNSHQQLGIQDISLTVYPGEMVLLLGPSGSGKTTMLLLMAGLIQPTTGEIVLFDKKISAYSAKQLQMIRANRIGFIFQNFLLLDSLNVKENIELVTFFSGISRRQRKARLDSIMHMLSIYHLRETISKTLSQGEKQRVAIARAIINNADLIIADEPTASLDVNQGKDIINLLHILARSKNRSVVVASHDMRWVDVADRVLFLQDGRLNGIEGIQAQRHTGSKDSGSKDQSLILRDVRDETGNIIPEKRCGTS